MLTKIVYRDKDGTVINIGDWDYMESIDPETGEKIINNPPPTGYTTKEENIITLPDGGLGVLGE